MSEWPLRLSALVVMAALAAGCDVHVSEKGVSLDVAHGKATDEWTRTYTVSRGGSVQIINISGPIVVDAGAGTQVEVKATREARASSDEDARALLQSLEMKEDVSPAGVRIETSPASGSLTGRRSASVEYHVRVPAGLRVSAKTENGGVEFHDVDGILTASTTNGGIRGTNVSGAVSAHVINGGIVVELTRVTGPIELDTVNGGIRLDLPRDLKADVDLKAVNGGVVAEDDLGLVVGNRSRNAVSGKLNGGGSTISASTVNGGVRIGVRTTATSGVTR